MSISTNATKRMAAAIAMLSVGGAGLTASLGGDGSQPLTTRGPVEPPSEITAAWLPDAVNDARAGITARRIAWGRYTLERARTAWLPLPDEPSASPADGPAGTDGDSSESRRPRTIVVTLPSYESGRPPSMTGPTFDAGQRPSVEPGWTTTVDLGEPPSATAPTFDQGESGTLHPPSVAVK